MASQANVIFPGSVTLTMCFNIPVVEYWQLSAFVAGAGVSPVTGIRVEVELVLEYMSITAVMSLPISAVQLSSSSSPTRT